MKKVNRTVHEVNDDLLAACACIGALADHVADHGTDNVQVLANLERASEGLHRLMVERRAVVIA